MLDVLQPLRYSTAELLGCALSELFPGTLLVDVTVTDIGFQCEVILKEPLPSDALPLVEERMYALVRQDLPIRITEMERHNAVAFLSHLKQKIRADQIKAAESTLVQLLEIGSFRDYCTTPCLPSTGAIGAFKLQSVHAYQKRTSRYGNVPITQIRGTAFSTAQELKLFLKRLKELEAIDHRRLIPEMQLLCETAPESANWIWEPQGMRLRTILCARAGFNGSDQVALPVSIQSPETVMAQLFKERPLYENTLPQSLYAFVPQGKELPPAQRWGLFRCNSYTQDIQQIACTQEQVKETLISSLQFIEKFFKIFGFKARWVLRSSQRDLTIKNGSVEQLKRALEATGHPWDLETKNPPGFWPRAERYVIDALGREWPTASLAIELESSRRGDLTYIDPGKQRQPVVLVTRSLFGSLERFVALLIEHYAGQLPLWLAPEQVRILLVGSHGDYAQRVQEELKRADIRSTLELSPSPLGEKIAAAKRQRIPYLLVVGNQEEKQQTVTVCAHADKEDEESMALAAFLKIIKDRDVA